MIAQLTLLVYMLLFVLWLNFFFNGTFMAICTIHPHLLALQPQVIRFFF